MIWPWRKKPERDFAPSRQQIQHHKRWMASEQSRLTNGWLTSPTHINQLLRINLGTLRSRSRERAMNDDYARRFLLLAKSNIVGSHGIMIQAQVRQADDPGQMDRIANRALEDAWEDWSASWCDYGGILSFEDILRLLVASMVTDGEFVALIHEGPDAGKYGTQLQVMDPHQIDTEKNGRTREGNIICLGVEYAAGKPVAYWINELDEHGRYTTGNSRRYPAQYVIHCFLPEWAGQARGIPWLSTALFRMKMLGGYEDAAITAARIGASKMGFYKTESGDDYSGDDADEKGNLISEVEAGSFEQLPAHISLETWDPTYPHEQFGDFMKSCLRGIAAGLGISYVSLANDLEGVNYSSIRQGVLEDRDIWEGLQEWMIRCFVRKIRDRWLANALLAQAIQIGDRPLSRPMDAYRPARYQGRRWGWVDPQKEMNAHQTAVELGIMSRSEIIRRQGGDPDDVFEEIADERKKMAQLGIPLDAPKSQAAMAAWANAGDNANA